MHQANNTSGNILTQNCREDWPEAVCVFANVCGLVSTAIWFVVLFPQIVKNWRRRCVVGLSVLWATANFTASLINVFFVFRVGELPLYVKISAVYMPVLEFLLLVQFWVYATSYHKKGKWAYLIGCVVSWTVIILVQVLTDVYQELQWCAIVLWSIETFPQVILNMQRMSTSGQSSYSVSLALVGKTTDFLSTYLLLLPLQYVVMTYYSSTMAYINGVQVLWYWRKERLVHNLPTEGARTEKTEVRDDTEAHAHVQKYIHFTDEEEEGESISPDEDKTRDRDATQSNSHVMKPRCSTVGRYTCIGLLIVTLAFYVAGLTWNTGSYLSFIAPGSVLVALISAYIYRRKTAGY